MRSNLYDNKATCYSRKSILQKHVPDVSRFDENLAQLLLDLEDTMYEVEASAICAPQIGILQKVAIIDMEIDGLLQLINPKSFENLTKSN